MSANVVPNERGSMKTEAPGTDPLPQGVARLVGFLYVAQMVLAIFGDSFVAVA